MFLFSYALILVAICFKCFECISHQSTTEPTLIVGHCAKTSVIVGELLRENLDSLKSFVTTTVGFQLNLGETSCIRVHFSEPDYSTPNATVSVNNTVEMGKNLNGTLLYSLQFQGLRQIYPIRQQYTFAIPQFESKCICDCPGGENHCAVGYNYKNCSKSSYCVTTYHPHQKATGCFAGEEAELCCDVTVTAYKNMKFNAVHLSQPSTAGQFAYKVYVFKNGQWIVKKSEQFNVPLNHDHRLEFSDDKLDMQISGTKSYWQLDSGMYFYQINDDTSNNIVDSQLRNGVPVNELYEWNTGKLGWFRLQDDRWTVANGWLEIQDAHHVQVEHCKDQRYTDNYKAHYYSSVGKNNKTSSIDDQTGVYIGHTVIESEPWIDSIILPNSDKKGVERQIIVSTKESPTITVNLNLNSQVELKFFFHESDVKDFTAVINLDKYSSKYLNLTIIEGKGTLLGAVYKNEKKQNSDLAFSTNVDAVDGRLRNSTIILLLPSDVNSSRYLCLHPTDKSNLELCKWVEYHAAPLEHIDISREWYSNQGECPGCNEMTWNSFLQYLNPKQWFDGISSASEAFAMIVEIGFYLIVIIVVIAICKRCVCPFLKLIVCGGSKSSKPAD